MNEIKAITRLVAGKGTKLVKGTNEVVGLKHSSIEAKEDSTFTSITGIDTSGNTIDLLIFHNMTGETLGKGQFLYTPLNVFIRKIKLATGSIFVH